MIFHELELKSFRQFAGVQTLQFATDEEKNVTVIHGYNGSGKTTLLNAFTWLFYGEFSPDFAGTEVLETESEWARLEPGDELETYVAGIFVHDGMRYKTKRRRVVKKDPDRTSRDVVVDGEVTLSRINEEGEYEEIRNPSHTLEQILPPQLQPFFFFNGERIEQLASPNAYDRVKSGIKVLLDIELLDRGIRHLSGTISDELRNEIAEHSGDEGRRAREERRALEQERDELQESREQLEKNQAALEEKQDRIDSKLRAMPDVAETQAKREEKENQLEDLKEQLQQNNENRQRVFSENSYLVFAPHVLDEAKGLLDDAHEQGQIPTPIKRQFVEELLDEGECICGRTLEEPDANERVVQWRDRAGSVELEQVATTARAEVRTLKQRHGDFLEEFDRLQSRREKLRRRRRQLREELDELSAKIKQFDTTEDPQALESERDRIKERLDNLHLELHEAKSGLKENREKLRDKDQEIKSLEKADKKGRLAQKRLDAVENVVDALERIYHIRHDNLRRDISGTLQKIWSDISIKDYQAELDDDYRLQLKKRIGDSLERVRGASTGEKQVLSLSFVSSLVEKARHAHENRDSDSTGGLFTGGLYPLVMDSPFGSLEVEYRRQVAKWVPELAPQIIMLVSETQWRREVEEEITPDIGREWILEVHTPKESRAKDIELHGRSFPYVKPSGERSERTLLQEVEL